MPSEPGPDNARSVTLRILPAVLFTFFVYLAVGLQLAVLPGYVHNQLGYGTVVAGLSVSIQSVATLLTRSHAGAMADTLGSKRGVLIGLACCILSALLLMGVYALERSPALALVVLLFSRLWLGAAESLMATCSTTWGIGRVGHQHIARVISWNGIATYGGLSLGAPLGVKLAQAFGFGAVGAAVLLLGVVGLAVAWRRPDAGARGGVRLSFRSVAARVFPHGTALGLGTVGMGSLATFITLFFASRQWDGAALALTVFGCAFIAVRLVIGNAISRFGGFPVARASLALEAVGLLAMWQATGPIGALAAAALIGLGFSLVFPSLGVEAVQRVPEGSRGAALGVYSVFFDVALAIVGPVMGFISQGYGFAAVYLAAAIAVLAALGLVEAMRRRWVG